MEDPHVALLTMGLWYADMRAEREENMKYEVNVGEVKNPKGNVKGFASVVFGGSFRVGNITILQNREGNLYLSMPHYKNSKGGEEKDICHPITKDFRQELEENIFKAFEKYRQTGERRYQVGEAEEQDLVFKVSVTPYEREGSNICGLARIYFDDCFLVNNVSLLQGKNGVFISMPSYKTKQLDENGKNVYDDICFPITKEFREKLNGVIMEGYRQAKERRQAEVRKQDGDFVPDLDVQEQELPFR